MSYVSRCNRCDELRQQVLVVRVSSTTQAAWICPECAVAWTPVTFFQRPAADAGADRAAVFLPKPCPCPNEGPLALVRRTLTGFTWTWVCVSCGTGQDAWLFQNAPEA